MGDLWQSSLVNVLTCLAFLAMTTFAAYRGVTTAEKVRVVLVHSGGEVDLQAVTDLGSRYGVERITRYADGR